MPSVTGLQVFEQVLIGSGCVSVRWTGGPNCNTHTHTFTWLKQKLYCEGRKGECSNRMSSRKTLGEQRGTGRLSNRFVGPEKTGWCFIQGKQTMGKMGGGRGGFIHFELWTGVSYWLWFWWGSADWLGSGSGVMVALGENAKCSGWE